MTTLYELRDELLALMDMDADDQAVKDTLEGIVGEIQVKATNIAHVMANMDTDISAIDTEIKRLQDRKKTMASRIENLRNYLRENMEASGIKKISCPIFSITLVEGRDVLSVDDEELAIKSGAPVRTKVELDKADALDMLKRGHHIEGLSIGKSKSSLRIK